MDIIDQECYVAFIDILGFKSLIKENDYEKMKEMYDKISGVRSYIKTKIEKKNEYKEACANSIIKIMSDSIILAIPIDINNSFDFICRCCIFFQRELALNRVFMRGGIAKGNFTCYCNEEIIFGNGLINAYLLESEVAKFPRIVVSMNIDINQYNKELYGNAIAYDQDEALYFLGFMSKEEVAFYKRIFYEELMKHEMNSNIKEKYLWLLKHCVEINT